MKKTVWAILGAVALAGGLAATFLALRSDVARTPAEDEGKRRIRAFWEAYNRATELRSRGEFSEAIRFYQQALTLDPAHEDSLYNLGNCFYELGEVAVAVKNYERLVEVNPQSNRGHSQLGIALSTPLPGADLDFERARQAFERVVEINREESGPFLRLGLVAVAEGKWDDAVRQFLIAAGFKSPEGTFLAGYVRFRQGRYREAARYFQTVLEMNAREKQISGRGVFSEGDVKTSSGQLLTPLEKSGIKALTFLHWAAERLGGYPHGVPAEFQIRARPGDLTLATTHLAGVAGRVTTADFDGDGDLDVAALGENGSLKVFQNRRGTLELAFDLQPRARSAPTETPWEAIWGDYDGDTRQDIYLISSGYMGVGTNVLYRNEGNGRFRDVTTEAGLSGRRATAQALFADYDRDGQLDIVEAGNAGAEQPTVRLFHNQDGRFQEVHQQAKINFSGNAVAVAASDYDGDGWIDFFILRWKQSGVLYRNNGDGTFTDMTEAASLKGVGGDSFSALFFDYDRDGLQDLLVTSQAPYEIALESRLRPDLRRSSWTPKLFRNRGQGRFEDVTSQAGLDRSYGTMQAVAVDVNRDGWTDMVFANGGLEAHRLEPSAILLNEGGKSFTEHVLQFGANAPLNMQSVAAADFNGDGKVELIFSGGVIVTVVRVPVLH
jgi:tetratricopeptide (TPR) repeat protein